MDFCEYCENMYYIREDDVNNIIFYCKNCSATKKIDNVNHAKKIAINNQEESNEKYTKYINPNIVYDSTIPHVNNIVCPNKECTKSKNMDNNVLYIKYDKSKIKYLYCCSYCKYFWTSKH